MLHITYIPCMCFQTEKVEEHLKRSVNDQLKSNKVFLFRNSITYYVIQKIYIANISGIHDGRLFINGKKNLPLNSHYSFGNTDTFLLKQNLFVTVDRKAYARKPLFTIIQYEVVNYQNMSPLIVIKFKQLC